MRRGTEREKGCDLAWRGSYPVLTLEVGGASVVRSHGRK